MLFLQKLNVFLERVMSEELVEDGTLATDMSKVCEGVMV